MLLLSRHLIVHILMRNTVIDIATGTAPNTALFREAGLPAASSALEEVRLRFAM